MIDNITDYIREYYRDKTLLKYRNYSDICKSYLVSERKLKTYDHYIKGKLQER